MSSCFNGDGHARQLRSQLRAMVATLAMLASGAAYAQSVEGVDSAETYVTGPAMDRTTLGTTPLRLRHATEQFGQEASETAIGGRGAIDLAGAVGFVDGQFRISNESRFGSNVGGGVRWYADDYLTGTQRILGVSGWYDGQETILNNYFNQGGVSFESLGEFIDFRVNANIPFEDEKTGDQVFITDDLNFVGNFLAQGTIVPTDVALRVVDAEAAVRVYDLNAWVYGGGYQMDGNGVSDAGAKVGARGYITNDLAIDIGVTNDDVFGTNTVFQIMWMPGRTGAGPTSWIHTLADRMREPVYRNAYIATQQVQSIGAIALTGVDGQELRFVHVDSNATAPGDGTFESPFTSLNLVEGGSQQGDIILVHAESVHNGEAVVLKDEQRFLGEGDNEIHTVVTAELGVIDIPETSPGALMAARPMIQNAPGTAITLSVGNDETEGFSEIEVSNFDITGGTRAIASSANGIGDVNINRLDISGTSSHAIELAALTETLANGTTRSRFTPTIDEVTFDGVGGDDIRLDSGTAETTISHDIDISDIVSTDGGGIGINLIENQRAVTITNFDWDGGTTGDGALRIFEAAAQGGVTLSATNGQTNDITGGTVGAAFAISLENSAATHTVTGTEIINMGGDSIVVSDGSANMNFTGRIEQTVNNASILSVDAGHTGSLTFTEQTTDAGVILAETGDGLQFDEANGVYTFNDLVELDETSQGINVVNSDGDLTFLNATITNTTGVAVNFNGGEASMTFSGKITQTANAVAVLNVSNEHTGTLVFNDLAADPGVIEATMGTGLQFNNADGAYTFNDEVVLNGGDAGIDVLNNSEGTFTFADADIDYSGGGIAVNIDDSDVQAFTLSGDIDVTDGRPIAITNNDGGSIVINATIDSSDEGILVENNTDTTIQFAGQTTLNTTTFTAVDLNNNTNGGVQFNNLDVTTTTGDGFVATDTDGLTVTGSGNTITSTGGEALVLTDVVVGGAGVTFQTVSADGGANGISLDNVTGGTVTVNGGTIQNTTGAGVVMTDSTNLALNNMVISTTGAEGIDYNLTTGMVSRLALVGNNISGTALEGVSMNVNVSSGAATANLRLVNNTITNLSDDEAIRLDTAGVASKTVNLLVQGNTVANDSATAPAANFQVGASTALNANVLTNSFTNTNVAPGRPFEMASNAVSSIVRLNLDGNNGSATSGDAFFLEENLGSFSVEERDDADTNNTGGVDFVPAIANFGNDPGNIPTPP